jgi:NADP-dependent 3-hydroxy acid dehydrogenase YdfG
MSPSEVSKSLGSMVGQKVVVIGASSGIGRGVALRSIRAGADVMVGARRVDRLKELTAEAGGGQIAEVDLRVEESCLSFVGQVRAELGTVDLLFISAGVAPLRRFYLTSEEEWLRAFATNVIGIHRIIASLLDTLSARAVVAVVSTEAVESPRSYLGAYGASKAALEHSIAQWREEHPWLRFTTISMGATVPTEFGHGFDPAEISDAIGKWAEAGRSQASFMDTEEVCDVLADTLGALVVATSVGVPLISLRSPAPLSTDPNAALEIAASQRGS